MLHRGEDDFPHVEGVDNLVQAADVIRVGVSADHVIQGFHPLAFQIRNNRIRLVVFTGVHQHKASVRLRQDAVSLADIDKMHGQPGFSGGQHDGPGLLRLR